MNVKDLLARFSGDNSTSDWKLANREFSQEMTGTLGRLRFDYTLSLKTEGSTLLNRFLG